MRRETLQDQLDELAELLGQMCSDVAAAMRHATTALLDNRVRLAERVIARDEGIDALRARIAAVAVETLGIHAPVAAEARTVVSAIRAAGDVERMGDLAQHVAEAACRRHPATVVPPAVTPLFVEMGRVSVELALKAAEVIRTRNVIMAIELDGDDDAMDDLHRELFTVLLDPAWPHGVAAAVDLTLLARFYERYADHAVAVARRMVYAVTGLGPDARPP